MATLTLAVLQRVGVPWNEEDTTLAPRMLVVEDVLMLHVGSFTDTRALERTPGTIDFDRIGHARLYPLANERRRNRTRRQ